MKLPTQPCREADLETTQETLPQLPELLGDEPRQFKLLVQSVMDYAIYMLDPNGYVRSWNAGGQRIKGYSDREIIGQHFSKFYVPEDVARGLPATGLAQARTHGRYESEGWRLRKDGSRFRASIVIDPIWQNGELIGFAKITRDVTERHAAQAKLLQTERELVQAQKIEAIGKLTFGLAHDFNNLLTVVINSLDLIGARTAADGRTQQLVDTALSAADRGALLTRQLLSFARGQNLAPEPRDINQTLSASMELYRRACGPAIRITTELAPSLPTVLVDVAQFEASILNLVSNSRDAMASGGTITLTTAVIDCVPPDNPSSPSRRYVCITVSDTGEGMPLEISQRATEPFFTTKEIGKGSGLGLSQVFGFSSQSGGFASLRSEVGVGTHVNICLPCPEA